MSFISLHFITFIVTPPLSQQLNPIIQAICYSILLQLPLPSLAKESQVVEAHSATAHYYQVEIQILLGIYDSHFSHFSQAREQSSVIIQSVK